MALACDLNSDLDDILYSQFKNAKQNGVSLFNLPGGKTASILGDDWDRRTILRRLDGSFHRPATYKGPPSKAVDEAWAKLAPLHLMQITELEFQNINASKHAVEIPDKEGGRLALFDTFHMMHCLKSLWENTYPEYYSEEHAYSQAHPEEWHDHIDHCTDMLRQKLVCDADPSVITYTWLKNHYYPHPNFNVEHRCRDYSRLVEFAESRKVKETFLRPEGKPVVDFDEPPFDPGARLARKALERLI